MPPDSVLSVVISIHAPRVGSDGRYRDIHGLFHHISIHAPRVGSDPASHRPGWEHWDFNPRSPCGERPSAAAVIRGRGEDFNPRSPCGERRGFRSPATICGYISIHAPRVGSDYNMISHVRINIYFNPRSPCGERRHNASNHNYQAPISIHAPRVGSDGRPHGRVAANSDFNPRSPCGERQRSGWEKSSKRLFQSTLPVWGATC